MIGALRNWLDHRVGYRKLMGAMLLEDIPGGAKWRYVWGSCLSFVFSVQLITGILLMTAYSPSDTTAWSSVFYIQYMMEFGWLIRGLHHFGSQTMVVLLALHMLQVVIAGAQLPPREVNWWLGLGLLGLVLGMSLTGYLLPWDQKGYWATQVATNIAGNLPVFGSFIQKIIVGGPSYGHHTLSRFFALHVAVLPAGIIVLMIAHIAVFRRHGVTAPKNATGHDVFWPDQAFRDMAAAMIVFAVMLGLVVFGGHGNTLRTADSEGADARSAWQSVALAGQDGLGANLDAPADPSKPYPARPEWYFLFLFQLLKYFEGDQEIVGTVVIPTGAGLVLFFLPLLGYGRMRGFGHGVGVLLIVALIAGAGTLTYLAIDEDTVDESIAAAVPDEIEKMPPAQQQIVRRNEKARDFNRSLEAAHQEALRAVQLAADGIPADGPVQLLRRDPVTQGPELFKRHCATCHRYGNEFPDAGGQASDLAGFGTGKWINDLILNAGDERFFGLTGLEEMAGVSEGYADVSAEDRAGIAAIARWLAGRPSKSSPDANTEDFKKAYTLFSETYSCMDCHQYEGSEGTAPDLTDYGSANWIRGMIMSPDHTKRYGENNAMPIFRDLDGADAEVLRQELGDRAENVMHLSAVERELIIRWLTGDRRLVFGGDPIIEEQRK